MSQETLANRVGTTKNYISKLESGNRNPSIAILSKILDVLLEKSNPAKAFLEAVTNPKRQALLAQALAKLDTLSESEVQMVLDIVDVVKAQKAHLDS